MATPIKIDFHPEAIEETRAARAWYRERSSLILLIREPPLYADQIQGLPLPLTEPQIRQHLGRHPVPSDATIDAEETPFRRFNATIGVEEMPFAGSNTTLYTLLRTLAPGRPARTG